MHRAKPWYAIVLLTGCGFGARSDTVADDILRSSGSYEVVRSLELGETLYTDTVALSFDHTFAALGDAYAALGLGLEHRDAVRGELSGHLESLAAAGGSASASWVGCPDVPEREARIEAWYGSRVTPSADGRGSVVQTVLRGVAHWRGDDDPIPCVSHGTLEAALLEGVRKTPDPSR